MLHQLNICHCSGLQLTRCTLQVCHYNAIIVHASLKLKCLLLQVQNCSKPCSISTQNHQHFVLHSMLQVVSSVCKVVHLQATSLQPRAFLHCKPCNANASAQHLHLRASLQCRPYSSGGARGSLQALQRALLAARSSWAAQPVPSGPTPSAKRWLPRTSWMRCWSSWGP